jgi:tetratricopeptide (TPR) repeat protein
VVRLYAYMIVLPLMLSSFPAAGQTDQAQHERHKQAAYAAFEVGRYDEAIDHFERAYRLKRDPRLLYNLGLAYYRRHELGRSAPDLRQARNLFKRFLQLVPVPAAGAPDRGKVLDARRYARKYLQKIELLSPPQSLPTSAPASLPTSMPSAARDESTTQTQQQEPAVVQASKQQERRDAGYAHWLLYALAGSAGVAAGVTGGLALGADHTSDDLARAGDVQANAEAGRARDLAIATDVLIGTAVVAAAVAVVLHLRSRSRSRSQ